MPDGEYIPVGSKSVQREKASHSVDNGRYDQMRLEERDQAAAKLITRIAELGKLGLKMEQCEVVYRIGSLAALARTIRPRKGQAVIDGKTYTDYDRTYVGKERPYLLVAQKGYMLPQREDHEEDDLERVLFANGTVGEVMSWRPFHKGMNMYIRWSPPENAYWCDGSGILKFVPLNLDDRFEPRNCLPVWGESLEPLSMYDSAYQIQKLEAEVAALAISSHSEI